jgi:hypothetical protein
MKNIVSRDEVPSKDSTIGTFFKLSGWFEHGW